MNVTVQAGHDEPVDVPVTKVTKAVEKLLRTCDRCGPAVQGYVRIMVNPTTDTFIDLCGHCYHVHQAAFEAKGYVVEDNLAQLAAA